MHIHANFTLCPQNQIQVWMMVGVAEKIGESSRKEPQESYSRPKIDLTVEGNLYCFILKAMNDVTESFRKWLNENHVRRLDG